MIPLWQHTFDREINIIIVLIEFLDGQYDYFLFASIIFLKKNQDLPIPSLSIQSRKKNRTIAKMTKKIY